MCCGRSVLSSYRGKILGTHTGIFLMCSDFFSDLAMKSPTKTYMPPKNLKKIQGKKRQLSAIEERRVVLPQSICSTCQNCLLQVLCLLGTSKRPVTVLYHHSEMPLRAFYFLFLNRLHFRHLNQFPSCGFSPSGQKHPYFSTNYSYYKSPSGPTQTAVLRGMLKPDWKHSQCQRIYK